MLKQIVVQGTQGFEKDPFDFFAVSLRRRRAQRIRCQWPWDMYDKPREPATGFLAGRLDDLISGRLVECDEHGRRSRSIAA